jgi:hypothetical protein
MASLWSCEERELLLVSLPSSLSVWDMKECEKEMMMMFVRMGGGVVGIMRN